MKFQELVKNIEENKDAVSNIDLKSVEEIAKRIDEVRSNNKTVFVAGNGGSSSTASHFVNDLMSIKKNKAFQKNHVVIIHREKSTNDNFEEILETILTKKYGRSKIIFGCFI